MPEQRSTDLLIIGAGPYGLAIAASAQEHGLDHLIVGEPMGFWRRCMPVGMFLRSSWDWHLDPTGEATIETFLAERNLPKQAVSPFSLADYLDYCDWFQQRKGLVCDSMWIDRLESRPVSEEDRARFVATAVDGSTISARRVAIALGFSNFIATPLEIAALVPAERLRHTHDYCDFTRLRGKRCLIVGGRQSAFEWAALIGEAGASEIHMTHRHPSPAFAEADWSWVPPLVDAMIDNPAWYRSLSADEKREVSQRLWAEGRLKVEPWLESRIAASPVTIWPETRVVAAGETPEGDLAVTLDNGEQLRVDEVILATGYKPDLARVPMLANGNLLPQIDQRDGLPLLDETMQASVPGLFMTSMLAIGSFGPFFAFTVAVRTSAKLIERGLLSG